MKLWVQRIFVLLLIATVASAAGADKTAKTATSGAVESPFAKDLGWLGHA